MKKILKAVLFILPFIVGGIGYILAGESISDSFYAAASLYGMNLVFDATNIWIEIARWAAPFATATALLYAFTKLLTYLKWRIVSFFHDSVAVYTDSDIQIEFGDKVREIYSAEVKKSAKSHIILMENDVDSFDFYERNRKSLKNKKVYIGLHEMEPGLLKENADVVYFDISGTIARLLWKKIKIWDKREKDSVKIVIWGNGTLAENILSYGLLLNLFSTGQHIRYVMVGDDIFHIKHQKMQLMNEDEITYLSGDSEDGWNELSDADIVIVADRISASTFQKVAVCARNAKLYYFSRHKGDIGDIVSAGVIVPFGRDEDIYTDESIRQEKLIDEAKKLNASYAEKYNGVSEWKNLSGFLKWSNISSADYMYVLKNIISNNPALDDDTLAELEHIRWCRFHYINYWKFGIPENGRTKDEKLKVHSCLRLYNELSEEDKDKDRAVVTEVRSKMVMK